MSSYPEQFYDIVKLSTVEVSESLGLQGLVAEPSQPYDALPPDELIGMLVFMGPELNGAFSVFCNQDYLSRTNPVKGSELQTDWLSEIANRVLGAVKARSAQLNVDFEVSIPITTQRDEFLKSSQTIGPIEGFDFNHDGERISVNFCGVFARSVTFNGTPDNDAVIGGLGDAVIFKD